MKYEWAPDVGLRVGRRRRRQNLVAATTSTGHRSGQYDSLPCNTTPFSLSTVTESRMPALPGTPRCHPAPGTVPNPIFEASSSTSKSRRRDDVHWPAAVHEIHYGEIISSAFRRARLCVQLLLAHAPPPGHSSSNHVVEEYNDDHATRLAPTIHNFTSRFFQQRQA